MRVFLGWSGPTSQKVALALRDWFPSVIQYAKPWVSSEDVAKGVRWSSDLAKELETSEFGVICVTKENWASPWINFEAGALSKQIDEARVSPLLFNLKPSEIHGPLVQFQYVVSEKEDIFKLLKSVNQRADAAQRLEETILRKVFDRWWADLSEAFGKIEREETDKPSHRTRRDPDAMLDELVEMTRALQRETFSRSNKDETERNAFLQAQSNLYNGLAATIGNLAHEVESMRTELASLRSPISIGGLYAVRSPENLPLTLSSLSGKEWKPATAAEQETNKPSSNKSGYGSGPVSEKT